MTFSFIQRVRGFWRTEFFSPKDFLRRAVTLALIFLLLHLAGLREFTSVLNGTVGSLKLSWGMCAFLGLAYIFAYLGFILLAPILVLGAALLALWKRFFPHNALPQANQWAGQPSSAVALKR
jgi:hypothetical protein